MYKKALLLVLCFSFIFLVACSGETSSSRPDDIREEMYSEAIVIIEDISKKTVNGLTSKDLDYSVKFANKYSDRSNTEEKVVGYVLDAYYYGSMINEAHKENDNGKMEMYVDKFNKTLKDLGKLLRVK